MSRKASDRCEPESVARLLAGPAFRRSRDVAVDLLEDPTGLQHLIDRADAVMAGWADRDSSALLTVDMACAVIEAHVEDLREGRRWRDEPDAEREEARYIVVTAALHLLVTDLADAGPERGSEAAAEADRRVREFADLVRWATWSPQNLLSAH